MGTWGHGILENDYSVDYFVEIWFLQDLGFNLPDIQRIFLESHVPDNTEFEFKYKYINFWTSLALSEWYYGNISTKVIDKMEEFLSDDSGYFLEKDSFVLKFINSIKQLREALDHPRVNTENCKWKLWFWEDDKEITQNLYAEELCVHLNVLFRTNNSFESSLQILKNRHWPLTEDFESAIFWFTVGKWMIDNKKWIPDIEENHHMVLKNLKEIHENPNSLKVLRIAYGVEYIGRIRNSMVQILNQFEEL